MSTVTFRVGSPPCPPAGVAASSRARRSLRKAAAWAKNTPRLNRLDDLAQYVMCLLMTLTFVAPFLAHVHIDFSQLWSAASYGWHH